MRLNGDLLIDDDLIVTGDVSGNLNASQCVTGTLPDARLSVNVLTHPAGYPGGTTNFLRADGTFAPPVGGSGTLLEYRYTTATTPPPSNSQLHLDVAHPFTTVTHLYVHVSPADGSDAYWPLMLIVPGQVLNIQDKTDHTKYVSLTVTGAPVDNGGVYVDLPVSWRANGTAITNQSLVLMRIAAAGGVAAHHATHENGGSDELSVAGLSGLLADGQTPLVHQTTHQSVGSDALSVLLLGGYPGGTTTFLRADGTFAAPTAIAGPHHASHEPGGSDALVNAAWTTVANVFTQTQTMPDAICQSSYPLVLLQADTDPVNSRKFYLENWGQEFRIAAWNDARTVNAGYVSVKRTGEIVTSGDIQSIKTRPTLYLHDTEQAVNSRVLAWHNALGSMYLQTCDDNNAYQGTMLSVTRAGITTFTNRVILPPNLNPVLHFGGISNSYPALRNTGAVLEVVSAGDPAAVYASLRAGNFLGMNSGNNLADLTCGGNITLSGHLYFSGNTYILRSTDAGFLTFCGGSTPVQGNGAFMHIFGTGYGPEAGAVRVMMGTTSDTARFIVQNSTSTAILQADWGGTVYAYGPLRVHGVGTVVLNAPGHIYRHANSESLLLCGGGGAGTSNGALIAMYGMSNPSYPGNIHFQLGEVWGSQFRFYRWDGVLAASIQQDGNIVCGTIACGQINGSTIYSSGAMVCGANFHTTGGYVYPGYWGGGQNNSFLLAAHGSYGLYSNTGLYLEGSLWAIGSGGNVAKKDVANGWTATQVFPSECMFTGSGTAGFVLNETSYGNNFRLISWSNRFHIYENGSYFSVDRSGNAFVTADVYERGRGTPMGHWVDVGYNAALFNASSGSWTVEAGDFGLSAYALVGKTLFLTLGVSATSVSVATTELRYTLPAGLAGRNASLGTFWWRQGGAWTVGLAQVGYGLTFVKLYRDPPGTAWSVGANNLDISGFFVIPTV